MNRECEVCKKRGISGPDLSFHRFPKNPEKKLMWFALLGFEQSKVLKKRSEICSDHFDHSDFEMRSDGIKYLKREALPKPYNPNLFSQTYSSSESSLPDSPTKEHDSPIFMDLEDNDLQGVYLLPETDDSKPKSFQCLKGEVEILSNTEQCSGLEVKEFFGETATGSEVEEQMLAGKSGHVISSGKNPEQCSGLEAKESSSETATGSEMEAQTIVAKPVAKLKYRKRRYVGDMSSDDFGTPRKRSRNLKIIKDKIVTQQKKIKKLHDTVRALRLRIRTLSSLLKYLKEKYDLSETSELSVKASLPGAAKEVFERMLRGPRSQKYSEQLRTFALTLSFYSPRAYNFVRETFNKSLPHLGTISKWYQSVDGTPGFNNESLVALKLKVQGTKEKVLCNLVMDEMSIRRQVEWTGTKFTGHVDIGLGIDSDMLPEAREAIVFMLVALNQSWKMPVGYFLIDGLSGSEKAEIVKRCLTFVHDAGVLVTSITFDGAPSNFTMAKTLGANFQDPDNLITSFPHPVTKDEVFIFLDPCHMLKLIRNCLASHKVLKAGNDQIDWEHFDNLVKEQNLQGLHAATKIRIRHLQWTREKMKVRLAAQTLSRSVSDALLFLSKDLKHPTFQKAGPTAEFALKFNNLFDIFNSRSRFVKYSFKKPMSKSTESEFLEFFDMMKAYIKNLMLKDTPILKSQRKVGFIGFLICIKSLEEMFRIYVKEKKLLKFILTYKLSQDHLELFFGAIRSRGGFNNNPTARQFEAAYKRLLVHSEITPGNRGNAIILEKIPILTQTNLISMNENGDNVEKTEEFKAVQNEIRQNIERENFVGSAAWSLTDYNLDVVKYISGFVVRAVKSSVVCLKCKELLESNAVSSKLQIRKTYGKLVVASHLVTIICEAAEKFFRFFNKTTGLYSTAARQNLVQLLISSVMNNLPVDVFNYFGDHLLEEDPQEGHCISLIKTVLRHYYQIRIHYEVSKKLELSKTERVRSINTKIVLFKNQ